MGLLLFIVGLLAAASGGLKMRRRAGSTIGSSSWARAETVLGTLTIIGSGIGLSRLRPLAWTAVAAVLGVTLVSSWLYVRGTLALHRRRERSEGARLKQHIERQAL